MSGEHGFVVFTLGSMVSDMPEEVTSVFLEAFRQIPQKVQKHLSTYENTSHTVNEYNQNVSLINRCCGDTLGRFLTMSQKM